MSFEREPTRKVPTRRSGGAAADHGPAGEQRDLEIYSLTQANMAVTGKRWQSGCAQGSRLVYEIEEFAKGPAPG